MGNNGHLSDFVPEAESPDPHIYRVSKKPSDIRLDIISMKSELYVGNVGSEVYQSH